MFMLKNPERNNENLRGSSSENLFSATGTRLDFLKRRFEMTSGVDHGKESLESIVDIHQENYDLSQSETDNENVRDIRKMDPVSVVGSVDASGFKQVWHKPDWYTPFIDASEDIAANFDLLDPETQSWYNDVSPALDVFRNLGTYDSRKFKRSYKNEIYSLCKSKGSKMVYGSKGVLNFLLAYRRVKNICPRDFKSIGVENIKLVVGDKKGKVNGAPDRKAYMLVRKYPRPGSNKFFKMYGIEHEEEFSSFIDQISDWLGNSPVDVFDSSLISKLSVEEGKASILANHGNSIALLLSIFDDFYLFENFSDFLEDTNNPDAQELRKLYFSALMRTIEFYEDSLIPSLTEDEAFENKYISFEKNNLRETALRVGDLVIESEPGNATVLNGLVRSANGMVVDSDGGIFEDDLLQYRQDLQMYKKMLAKL